MLDPNQKHTAQSEEEKAENSKAETPQNTEKTTQTAKNGDLEDFEELTGGNFNKLLGCGG